MYNEGNLHVLGNSNVQYIEFTDDVTGAKLRDSTVNSMLLYTT